MPAAVTIATPINELDSALLECSALTKEDGTPIGAASLETLTLTLYDIATDEIINDVEDVDILNTGRGTLDESGRLLITLYSEDNPITDETAASERHKALIVGTWNTGKGHTSQEVIFTVTNINKVPVVPPGP